MRNGTSADFVIGSCKKKVQSAKMNRWVSLVFHFKRHETSKASLLRVIFHGFPFNPTYALLHDFLT